jgi:hypothetical protein
MKNNLRNKLEAAVNNMTLPTFNQRMAAEAILDFMIEGVISDREATRQLGANGIEL